MKAKHLAVLLAAHAALFAAPSFADDCRTANMHCQGAVAPVSHGAHADHAMSAKDVRHDMPDVGGADAYKTQSGKRENREDRDSIDAWYRGG